MTFKKTILVSDKVHPLLMDGLRAVGMTVDYHPLMSYDEVKSQVKDYDGIVINSKVICDKAFIDSLRQLDFIGRLGSGLDIIDLPYAALKGIEVISSPEGNSNAVAEHVVGMLLGLLANIGCSHQDIQNLSWNRERNRGEEIIGKTIGIIGYGHTGPALASKLVGFDVHVMAYDKYRDHFNGDNNVEESTLENLVNNADIISIHLPLTEETTDLIDTDFLKKVKHGAIIINTSRGKILDSNALLEALASGHIQGACLDVLENEKPETWNESEKLTYNGLLQRKNVVITPHIAGWTHRSLELIASILLRKICSFYGIES